MTSKWAMAILIAALMVLPQALAIQVDFGGLPGSTSTTYSSTTGTSIGVQNTLSSESLASTGDLSDYGAGDLSQYFEWNSWDGKEKAAAYAYLADSGKYKYTFAGTSGKTSATAGVTFYAEDAQNILLGGFAYNPTDYAATFAAAASADDITYKNTLSASASKVSAAQNFYGTNFADLQASTWAERGNIDNEVQSEDGSTGSSWGVLDMWDATKLGAIDVPFGYTGGIDSADLRPNNEIFTQQTFTLKGGSIKSATPYKSSASLASNTAASSQSVTLYGTSATATAFLYNRAAVGDGDTGYDATGMVWVDGLTSKSNNMVYSASAKATPTQATLSQTENIQKAANIYRQTSSNSYGDKLNAVAFAAVLPGGSGISSSMSGTDSATAKAGSSSVTHKAVSSGASVYKDLYANNNADNYHARAMATAAENIATTPSTISGQSTVTATTTGASVLSKGKWKAVIAKNAVFARAGQVVNDNSNLNPNDPINPSVKYTYEFMDNYKATATLAQAL